jgi:hypothetical protein
MKVPYLVIIANVIMAGALGATSAVAQPRSNSMDNVDMAYHVPLPANRPDLEPYATFDIQWSIRTQNGHHVLTFDLPEELQGGDDTTIEFTDTNPGAQIGETAHFEGPNGTANCDGGDWNDVMCHMVFQNLPHVDPTQSQQFLNGEFGAGTPSALGHLQVQEDFGGEPMGDVHPPDCPECKLGDGTWSVRYFNGQWVMATMTLLGHTGTYQAGGAIGTIADVGYNDGVNEAKGHWSMNGQTGWFDFHFQNNGTFTGQWGYGLIFGKNPQGPWNGQRAQI